MKDTPSEPRSESLETRVLDVRQRGGKGGVCC